MGNHFKVLETDGMVLKKFDHGCYAKNQVKVGKCGNKKITQETIEKCHARDQMVVWINEWLSVGNGEKWSDLRYLLKVKPV